ncbi:MAG TPA: hypothetical protein VL358_03175 [Caulobacteraceae bacterium]|jgi:hypothetical protein|nr:hypothetical protein [Caulobacteraceae bacterium]
MRTLVFAGLIFLPALVLGACASQGRESASSTPLAGREMARLQRECEARGGMLLPSGRLTGQTSLDNVCKILDPTAATP